MSPWQQIPETLANQSCLFFLTFLPSFWVTPNDCSSLGPIQQAVRQLPTTSGFYFPFLLPHCLSVSFFEHTPTKLCLSLTSEHSGKSKKEVAWQLIVQLYTGERKISLLFQFAV
uniref:Uncharacterized protein n=1 Tax=Trypanosoma vivax (strain Y486) TaxID=1055687 RepID=G0UAM4_TRYVY|nr:hypothetical protein TVY486_1103430 [Trypanosoma vivax Y486]